MPITVDPIENEDRYNFMSTGQHDGDDGPGDRRMLMATGPFNIRPGDSARIVVGIILGSTATGKDATGTTDDMAELVRKVRFAQFVYDNQFRAPQAPDYSVIRGYESDGSFFQVPAQGWLGLNNSVVIKWDSTSELSIDTLERGLDFLGYRIYRARRTDLDTFDVDNIPNQRKGPLAWKQIGRYEIPVPFIKSGNIVPVSGVAIDEFEIADVIKAGQKKWLVARSAANIQPWFTVWSIMLDQRPPGYLLNVKADSTLDVSRFDRFDSVRFTYFSTQFDVLPQVHRTSASPTPYGLNATEAAAAKDSLIKLILAKKVKMEPFLYSDTVHTQLSDGSTKITNVKRPFEESSIVRHQVIGPYFNIVTNHRTFFDFGDDDGNGEVLYDANPEKSEKLINNIEYTYAVRAYDEGDFLLHTSPKLNIKAVGLPNTVKTMPLASRPGKAVEFEFVLNEADRPRLGGIYNLRLLVQDEQRFNQLFAGKTLEVEFYRDWFGYNHDAVKDPMGTTTPDVGMYNMLMILRDSTTGDELNRWSTTLPPALCGATSFAGFFSENSLVYVDTTGRGITSDTEPILDTVYNPGTGQIERIDTTTFHFPTSNERIVRSGNYTTAAPCFGNKYAFGSVGLAFDYAIEQWGGIYRTGGGEIVSGGDPNIYFGSRDAKVYNESAVLNQPPAYFIPPYPGWTSAVPWNTSYNNGPGVYEITFTDGGTETITTPFIMSSVVGDAPGKNKFVTFENVKYLNMSVRNVAEFNRSQVNTDGSLSTIPVNYPFDLSLVQPTIDTASQVREFPNPELVPIGSYAIAGYGWRNTQNGDSKISNLRYYAADTNQAHPVGQGGRYYQSRTISTTGEDTLDFVHVMTIAGSQFTVDFARKGKKSTAVPITPTPPDAPSPQSDFKAGDKIRVYTYGGALGYPFDHVKAYARIKQYDPEIAAEAYTDEQLDQIQVVPNPFYVTHEGIRSPFEGKLYFTRLPRKATISIYTTNGDLINTFQHDESTSDDPSTYGTYVWDLLTKNRQRVTSQMLIAKIETPDGASTTRKFSIVVGPARISSEE